MNVTIRKVYLYLTSLVGLVLMLIGAIQLVNLGLKTWVFTKADMEYYGEICDQPRAKVLSTPDKTELEGPTAEEIAKCEQREKERRQARKQADAARSIAFILVGLPVYLYHWNKIKGERDV